MKSKDGVYILPGVTLRHGRLLRNQQTKRQSITEAIVNVFSGAVIAFILTDLLAEPLGIVISGHANLKLTIILTIVSVIRGYLWRRYFNRR